VVRATVPGTEDLALESLEEHHIVKWVLSELDHMSPEDEPFDAKVTVLPCGPDGFAFTLTPGLTWDDGGNLGGWGGLLRRFGDCCEAGPWKSCGRLSAGGLVRLGRRGPRTVRCTPPGRVGGKLGVILERLADRTWRRL
jgi:hypothetical protein